MLRAVSLQLSNIEAAKQQNRLFDALKAGRPLLINGDLNTLRTMAELVG